MQYWIIPIPWRINSQHTHINLPYRTLTSVGTARKCCALETNVSNFFFFQNTSLALPLYSTVFPMRQPVQIDPCFHILGVLAPLEEKVNKSHLLFFFFLITCISQKFPWRWGYSQWAGHRSAVCLAESALFVFVVVPMPNKQCI